MNGWWTEGPSGVRCVARAEWKLTKTFASRQCYRSERQPSNRTGCQRMPNGTWWLCSGNDGISFLMFAQNLATTYIWKCGKFVAGKTQPNSNNLAVSSWTVRQWFKWFWLIMPLAVPVNHGASIPDSVRICWLDWVLKSAQRKQIISGFSQRTSYSARFCIYFSEHYEKIILG